VQQKHIWQKALANPVAAFIWMWRSKPPTHFSVLVLWGMCATSTSMKPVMHSMQMPATAPELRRSAAPNLSCWEQLNRCCRTPHRTTTRPPTRGRRAPTGRGRALLALRRSRLLAARSGGNGEGRAGDGERRCGEGDAKRGGLIGPWGWAVSLAGSG
jgi:hypothetical protein